MSEWKFEMEEIEVTVQGDSVYIFHWGWMHGMSIKIETLRAILQKVETMPQEETKKRTQ